MRTELKTVKLEPKAPWQAKHWLLVLVPLVILAGATGGFVWWRMTHPPEDPQVAKVKELQQQLFRTSQPQPSAGGPIATTSASTTTPSAPLDEKQREAAMAQLRAEMEKLSEEQRDEVRRGFGEMFRERMRAAIKEYRGLPKEQRVAFLDKQIDEWEQRRSQFQRGGGPPGGPGGSRDGQRGDGRRGDGSRADGQRGDGQRPDGPRQPPSDERRLDRRRERLSQSTPQERAEMELYFSDMNERRKQRGLEPFGPRR